jgi:Zn-finger nucleic acid-binding protein
VCATCRVPLVLEDAAPVSIEFTCPWCKATVDANARRCAHCARPFGVPRCGQCGGRVDPGLQRCAHCGAPVVLEAPARSLGILCPVCDLPLEEQTLGRGIVLSCGACHGVFVSHELLDRWTDDRAADAPDDVQPDVRTIDDGRVRYRRCPRCAARMNRANFGPGSGIILDACREDGVWLDGGELQDALAFARSGRLESARARHKRERAQLDEQAQRVSHSPGSIIGEEFRGPTSSSMFGSLIGTLLRRLLGD